MIAPIHQIKIKEIDTLVKVDETEFYDKWSKRLKGSSVEMKRGADRVTRSPGLDAADAIDLMFTKLKEAFDSGRVERALRSIDLEFWRKQYKDKGMKNLSAGVDAAKEKQLKFAKWLLTRVKAGQDKIKDMDKVTLEDSIARMETFIRHMAEEKYK